MYITTVSRKNPYSSKVFEYQRLVESIRTSRGPRQKFILNLGKLPLPKSKWELLVQRIEDIIHGQESLLPLDPEIERLAQGYAQDLIQKLEEEYDESGPAYELLDIDSLSNSRDRRIGAEYVSLSYLRRLGLESCLEGCKFTKRQVEVACLLIIGRMVWPGSEKRTYRWARYISGLDELLDTDFRHLSLKTLYRVSDKILKNKEAIERHLRDKERDLFSLDEKIILYDLTNTFFEGVGAKNSKAKFGRSKEKRNDCRLVTLGLILDGNGFPKASRVFPGNQSEPVTLLDMVKELKKAAPSLGTKERPTIVIDAGIATEENLRKLKKDGYHYICVSRKRMKPPESDDFVVIKNEKANKIEAHIKTSGGEVFLYCKTRLRQKKEKAIQSRLEQYFEAELDRSACGLKKKGGIKNYQKVCERIGRAREKYAKIAQFYEISVEEKDGRATSVNWKYVKKTDSDNHFSGSYWLRTDRTDLSEEEIWDIYTMLTDLEDAFRTMKSEIGIRPNYHQKEDRSDGHIFITLIAYHIVHSIRTALKNQGINYRWETIRSILSTHNRVTNRLKSKEGKTIYVRKCIEAEPQHKLIYDALNLDYIPCKPKKCRI